MFTSTKDKAYCDAVDELLHKLDSGNITQVDLSSDGTVTISGHIHTGRNLTNKQHSTGESTMQESKSPKRKQRQSNKVVIKYTNKKPYTIKNLKCKPDVYKDTIVVNYIDNEVVDGVKFKRDVQVEIPTKDVLYLTILPCHTDKYMDTDFVFNEGKVVSKANYHKDCYGKKEYVSYGY